MFKREHEEFTVIEVNLNIVKKDGEEHLYDEDDLYLKSNNAGYHSIIWINCIYNYCRFYLEFKTINNFFFKAMSKSIKKVYKEEETRY